MKYTLLLFIFFNLTSYSYGFIIGGETVPQGKADGVLNIFTTNADGEMDGTCTASKIGARFILTAAHCVHGKNVKSLGWSNSSKVDLGDENETIYGLHAKNVHIHPSYEFQKMFGQTYKSTDMAIIEIDTSKGNHIDKFENLPSMELDFNPVLAGEKLQSFGYGCESQGDFDNLVSRKKSAEVKMLPYNSLSTECAALPSVVNQNASKIYTTQMVSSTLATGGKASLCDGDSGGPTIRNGKIVGVNASYLIDQTSQTEEAYFNLHSRLSEVQGWVRSIVQ